ncbi:DUF599 domain-containing protein [Propionivibrio dicarboxylicus]|uniref:Uncharacterized membrane protein n=1 Tax=Propionivibrio dicarboxylicus TaxID=83767 RepID=A0A1G8L2V2_9RHOO|nr:DUF599 domain-containing protein [Propionivibrio dicarboxylicus]SDI49985.1 Uncharacterized membrane protein [Propionivibrio dicarboxylicus]
MSFLDVLAKLSRLDWIGLVWFLVCWLGFELVVDRGWLGKARLQEETHKQRLAWGGSMVRRENRILDSSLIANLLQSLSFYANTSIYIIGALFAALGALDQLIATASELPFSPRVLSREAVEIKLLILISVFVVAYFKFTWSLRQFNLLSITVGSVPHEVAEAEVEYYARKFAAVNTCAGNDFNRGLRAYYFGMAVMSWMVSAWAFIGATAVIAVVLARREFDSPVLMALRSLDES